MVAGLRAAVDAAGEAGSGEEDEARAQRERNGLERATSRGEGRLGLSPDQERQLHLLAQGLDATNEPQRVAA